MYNRMISCVLCIVLVFVFLVAGCGSSRDMLHEPEYSAMDILYKIREHGHRYPDCPVRANAQQVWAGRDAVMVHLIEYSEYQIMLFRETIVDSPLLEFVESDGPLELYCEPVCPVLWDVVETIRRHNDKYPYCPVYANVGLIVISDDTITVRLIEYDEYQIALFRETIVDSPFVVFRQYGVASVDSSPPVSGHHDRPLPD